MATQYYTVCEFENGQWHDRFGSYCKKEAKWEAAFIRVDLAKWQSYRYKPSLVKVICHDDTAAAMIAARDALRPPK